MSRLTDKEINQVVTALRIICPNCMSAVMLGAADGTLSEEERALFIGMQQRKALRIINVEDAAETTRRRRDVGYYDGHEQIYRDVIKKTVQ